MPAIFRGWKAKKVKGMTVTYGRKCSGLSEKLSRLGYLVRTYLESCPLPGKQFVRTWSVRDTLSPYLILKLRLSERRTGDRVFFVALHKLAMRHKGQKSKEFYEQCKRTGESMITLTDQARHEAKLWPTPRFMYKDRHNRQEEQGQLRGSCRRAVESRLGGMANGISCWLDGYWRVEPNIPRVATGVKNRVDRLKCPQCSSAATSVSDIESYCGDSKHVKRKGKESFTWHTHAQYVG